MARHGGRWFGSALVISSLGLSALLSQVTYASERACSSEQAKRAESAIDRLRSWRSLYNWYQSYRQCDDGAISEGYSEAVARTLVDHWDALPQFSSVAQRDSRFRRFVLRHIDETLNDTDLKTISSNAEKRCPSGLSKLCCDLKREAEAP